MIGYVIVGPILALLVSLKLTDKRLKEHQKEYEALVTKVELLQTRNEEVDKEMLQKIMTTVMPIAKAVNKLNTEVGLR
jgi:chromosome segregation ATPase